MSITVTPTHPEFVAEISGVDLARPLQPADRDAIEDVINRYAIVVFHDQTLTDHQQIDFARHFGPIQSSAQKARHTAIKHRIASNDIADISNLDGDGKVLEPDSKRRLDWLANRLWHTDASFRAVPGALSMLYAHVVPDEGGETEFADCRAAYDALPDALRAEAEQRFAEHWVHHSRSTLGWEPSDEEIHGSMPPVRWPLVRVHSGSGREVLYMGAHARRVIGMPLPAGRILLRDLVEHATQPAFVYRHAWRSGDLVLWDNRAVMHRGCRYDLSHVRDMRRTTVLDLQSINERDCEDDLAAA